MSPFLTKQPTVLGLPIGRRRTDWVRVGKLAAMGVGALSSAAGGLSVKRVGTKLRDKVSQGAEMGKQTVQKVGQASEQVSDLGKSLTGGKEGGDKQGGGKNLKKLRLVINESVDVGVPLRTAYNQWTQFTEMPAIMGGPQNIEQESDDETKWTVKIGPSRRRWTARIVEQNPDERIAWESTDGAENRGVVSFHRLDRNLTRVHLEMEYFPNGAVEKVGNLFYAARRRARKDLRLFEHFLELAGAETGAWRGEISLGDEEEGGDREEQGQQARDQQAGAEQGRGEGGDDRDDAEQRTAEEQPAGT